MKRRSLLVTSALAAAGCRLSAPASAQPSHTVSKEQLDRLLAQRFPRRLDVSGLLEIELRAPALRLLVPQNRLGAGLPLEAAGPALRRRYAGSVDLDFALRYEAADRSIRAHQIRVNAVRLDGLGRDGAQLLDAYVRRLSEQALLEVVLHQLRPQDLALASTMGFEPGEITVTEQGLAVRFVPQRCSGNPAGCPCTPASGECVRP